MATGFGITTLAAPAKPAGLQKAVRNFQFIETKPQAPPKVNPPLPGEGSEAFITWGAAGSMSAKKEDDTPEKAANNLGQAVKSNPPVKPHEVTPDHSKTPGKNRPREQKKQGQDKQAGTVSLDMIDFQSETGKIYSPDDPDVWVKVSRMTSMRFRGSLPTLHTDAAGVRSVTYAPAIYKINMKFPAWPSPPKAST